MSTIARNTNSRFWHIKLSQPFKLVLSVTSFSLLRHSLLCYYLILITKQLQITNYTSHISLCFWLSLEQTTPAPLSSASLSRSVTSALTSFSLSSHLFFTYLITYYSFTLPFKTQNLLIPQILCSVDILYSSDWFHGLFDIALSSYF